MGGEYVINSANILLKRLPNTLLYHNKNHTLKRVLPQAMKLAQMQKFGEKDLCLMMVAAAFHDTGFLDQYNHNESNGAAYAESFMTYSGFYADKDISKVANAILSTSPQQSPQNTFEAVLCDADVSYFGCEQTSFLRWLSLLRQEAKLCTESSLYPVACDDKGWLQSSLDFLKNHKWYSFAGHILYNHNKEKNQAFLENLLQYES